MPKPTTHTRKHIFIKHKKRVFIALAVFLVLIVLPTTALAYVGFVPGLTEAMHTNKPVNLGVTYNTADFQSFQKNTLSNVSNFEGGNTAPGAKLVIFGADTIDATLTQEELSAFVNMVPWTGSPLSNSQIRLSDGMLEFSGNVRSAYVSNLIRTIYPSGNYGQLSPFVKLAGHLHNPAVYVKFGVSVTQTDVNSSRGQLHLNVLSLKVNRMDFSQEVSKMNAINVQIPEGSFEQGIAYSLSSLSVSNGSLSLHGTLPAGYSVGNGDPSVICNEYHGTSLVSLSSVDGRIGSVLKYCN